MTQDIWVTDSETFAHDNLWVFKRYTDGLTTCFWNDSDGVRDFIELNDPVLVGYNIKNYDQYILKATLLGWSPEDIKVVNDTIIQQDDWQMVWELFTGSPWVDLPPMIDLWADIVPRMSLKSIEANIGMSIVESSVPFDIDRPLTTTERDEVLRYCIHDVNATKHLYDLRLDYLRSKSGLCELRGVDPLTMLKHSNARIVSEVLEAARTSPPAGEIYTIPDNIDLTAIPESVIDYVGKINTDNCVATDYPSLPFIFHGCPTVVGLGGIHAAVPSYKETASDERAILMQDIGSFYPSLILNNGYMSRAVADPSAYKQFYDIRMTAKADGDKATADAAKLVLNTTYGTMKDTYNKMFDPMQGTRVCLSGQLYIIDLIENLYRAAGDGLTLIQLNTDGWVISCPRSSVAAIQRVVEAWQQRTNLTVETDEVETIVQANVNNYVLRFATGKIKAKGGVVARFEGRNDPDGNWWKSNSATIIDKAVVSFLLDNVPVSDTIDAETDIERFQIVAKAGRTFQKVVWHEHIPSSDAPVETEVQRVNRVFATTDTWRGGIFKVKLEQLDVTAHGDSHERFVDGIEIARSRIPLTPDNCLVDNGVEWKKGLTTLDKAWYIELAQKKAHEFITRKKEEREQMADTTETTNELQQDAPKPTRKKAEPKENPAQVPEPKPAPSFKERLLALQGDMAKAAQGVKFDGVISNISYEYADTQQYKAWLAALCTNHGLIVKLDVKCDFLGVIGHSKENKEIYAAQADGIITITDVASDAFETYTVSGFGSNVQPGYCNGGAQTNLLRNFILNNYLLDNKGREGDDQAFNAATDSGSKSAYVAPAEKAQMKQGIADGKAEDAKHATDMFVKALYDKIIEAQAFKPKFGAKMLAEHFSEDGTPILGATGKSTMLKQDAVTGLTKAEEIIAEGAKVAE